ncbi:unnamed protein product [Moneuplotes crassus]|uniref:Uncharacterized protein n=1 Tax=Euplotes crassus TaxID=5936 RepID=A0AAD1UAL3_EUPCR|nr:unnamed protein product [Moneuplotes crassus]
MSYKVYKKNVSKYSKNKPSGIPSSMQSHSGYLFTSRSITPDKSPENPQKSGVSSFKRSSGDLSLNKPGITVKKSGIYGRNSGASTDRSHILNRNLSLSGISSQVKGSHSRNLNRTKELKSKGSISSNSSYQNMSNGKLSTCKMLRGKTGEETDRELKLLETIKLLKSENKKLYQVSKDSEKSLLDKIKESRKEMEKMTTIINQLWPFIQSHLKREIGSSKIASLKRMAKEESRVDFLDTLSKVIGKVKKDAEKEGRSLFGTDTDSKYEKLKRDHAKFDHIERNLKAQLKEREIREAKAKELIDKLQVRIKELDAFRLTTTDHIMTKATTQEEILFLIRANERIRAFQDNDFMDTEEKFEDGGFITNKRHYEILDDYEPAPSFLKALTNEILYLEEEEDDLMNDSYSHRLFSESNIISSDYDENKHDIVNPYLHVQKINTIDQVPGLIKDTLDELRSRNESYDEHSYQIVNKIKHKKTESKRIKTARERNLNKTSEYSRHDPMGLTSHTSTKLGTSLDRDNRSVTDKSFQARKNHKVIDMKDLKPEPKNLVTESTKIS